MILFGFEDFNVALINYYFFKGSRMNSLLGDWHSHIESNDTLRIPGIEPFYKLLKRADLLKNDPVIKDKLYLPAPGEVLYFDKTCTIPRIKCEERWKRTIKPQNANVIVVPDLVNIYYEEYAIFQNVTTRQIFLLRNARSLQFPAMIGMTVGDLVQKNISSIDSNTIYQANIQTELSKARDAVCIYVGDLYKYPPKQQYIMDIIDGVYPRICFESMLLDNLGDEHNSFDEDTVSAIIDMLNSKDRESVHNGMRVLASLDYIHYPAVTKYILATSMDNWRNFKPFNSAVKFMLESLGVARAYHIEPFQNVSEQEFDLAKGILEKILIKNMQSALSLNQSRTNLRIICPIDLHLEYPNRTSQESESDTIDEEAEEISESTEQFKYEKPMPEEDDCPDCPDFDDLDFSFANP